MRIRSRQFLMYSRLALGIGLFFVGVTYVQQQHNFLGIPIPSRQAAGSVRPAALDKNRYSHDSPSSPWVVVNKQRPLKPIDYAPQLAIPDVPLRLPSSDPEMQVSQQMAPALHQLVKAAKKAGLDLMLASGYRSYKAQVAVYDAEVNSNGQSSADRESARPGYSEHQTGLAADLEPIDRQCEVEACFGTMPEGKWLAANAHTYGFVIRYSQANEHVTGYTYEPWHIRYVGTELSKALYAKNNQPLETFFGLGAAPNYP